eukprot:2036370-Amphidinium_carterae.1
MECKGVKNSFDLETKIVDPGQQSCEHKDVAGHYRSGHQSQQLQQCSLLDSEQTSHAHLSSFVASKPMHACYRSLDKLHDVRTKTLC